MTSVPPIEPLQRYLETLTAEKVPELAGLVANDVRFIDPFNDVNGVEATQRVFAAIFVSLKNVRFTVIDRAWSGNAWYLRWRFEAERRQGGQIFAFDGMSELYFDIDGRVRLYRDHWDAASGFYEKLPILGLVLRWLRRRIADA
ncbi:MAG: nuclear transport factor 2 family protein [Elstera sp.]